MSALLIYGANGYSGRQIVATAADGRQCRTYQQTREGYAFTNLSAVEIARRVLAGEFKPGYQTPGGLFGADFVLDIEGSLRRDLD